ncbi:hypothetical protein [Candidatus Methylacidithermus pantelleriae]|uniref:DUF5666 domain-containing protein n=1 Tax=Candidatus Methylacidithermus pantelleriae TaxID=2744239 RepID=A0A8J2FTR1_9BACT|nr:hypothetical protein [Candidatus Methylacidithermus pantelleriae]CAF0704224.1 conserved exported hypothetical protein [Candidatus Methylacidithermus pantelleriae]
MRKVLLFVWLASSVGTAYAHGNFEHILGTIKEVHPGTILVETRQHQIRTVSLPDKVPILQDGHSISWKDLKPGQRVVIHAKKSAAVLQAHEVKVGKAP